MKEKNQQRLETLLEASIAFGLNHLVVNRLVEDLVPEQRGAKDDILRGALRGGATAAATVSGG